jgi:hypothetical protein
MEGPAPLELLQRKLASRDERVRIAALQHVAAHGPAARRLAARVAAMLADESPTVQWHATRAFRAIGYGATHAIPVLLDLRDRGGPEILMTRTAACLGCIGPTARSAIAPLKAELDERAADRDLLEALLQIAPDDKDVMAAVIETALLPDFRTSIEAGMMLWKTDGKVIDRAFAEIGSRVRNGDRAQHAAAARLLSLIAEQRPSAAAVLLRDLLHDPIGPGVWNAVQAVGRLPAPRPLDLVNAVIRVATVGTEARAQALDVLAELGTEAAAAQEVFLNAIEQNATSMPVPGENGEGARCLAAGAKGLAAACPTERAVQPLLAWLSRLERARMAASNRLNWYPIGKVVEALALLAPQSHAVSDAILSTIEIAQRCFGDDASGVIDFHRSIRTALERLPNSEAMFREAEKLGMPHLDPYGEKAHASESAADELLPIPDDDEPEPKPGWEPIDEDKYPELLSMAAAGWAELGLGDAPSPQETAKAVDRWLTAMQGQKQPIEWEISGPVLLAWGDAIARQTGWEWGFYLSQGEQLLALAAPDRAHVHLPVVYIFGQLERGAEVTAELLFNMLAAGERPPAQSGDLSIIG